MTPEPRRRDRRPTATDDPAVNARSGSGARDELVARRRSVFPGFAELGGSRHALVDELISQRRTSGVSQAEVAQRMGTSQPAVARLEAGDTDIRLSTLARYAAALDHDLVWDLHARPRKEP